MLLIAAPHPTAVMKILIPIQLSFHSSYLFPLNIGSKRQLSMSSAGTGIGFSSTAFGL